MSIRDFSYGHFDPTDLPTWRKIVVLGAVGVFLYIGGTITLKEIKIYETAPSAPVAASRQVHPVRVMHGYERYVTQREEEDFAFWKNRMGTLVGIPFIVAFLVLVTYRKGKETQVSS